MKKMLSLTVAGWLGLSCLAAAESPEARVSRVARTPGLVAFWDFSLTQDGRWTSYHDDRVIARGFPVSLRRIGDPKSYTPANWPYDDERSKLVFDSSGPFGHAVRFDQGFVFAEVARADFDRTPLDIHGRQPFTLMAWTKFVGQRHLVAGIWDEGGWDKYGGRRQVALFGGLFGSKGVIAHISTTGAASYPQSTAAGSQYARCRAIDGRSFENDRWVAMAMTFDPAREEVRAYCDGAATATQVTDPVEQDVLRHAEPQSSNPYHFPWPVFSTRAFVLKFNGSNVQTTGVREHWLYIDTDAGTVRYDRSCSDDASVAAEFRVRFAATRDGASLLPKAIVATATPGATFALPETVRLRPGDEIVAALQVNQAWQGTLGEGADKRLEAASTKGENQAGQWTQVGTEIRYRLREGAPFTFGRALGLGTEPIAHGTQLYLDGVAVFNRVLSASELAELSFAER